MTRLTHAEKVEAIKSRLGKTPSQVNVERLAKHNEFLKEKNRLDNEKKKADEEAEKLCKTLHEAKQEEARVAQKEAQEASEAARKAQEAIDIAKSQERKEREKKAREWIFEKNLEAREWLRKNTRLHTGQPMSYGERKAYDKAGIIEPNIHHFTNDWFVKPQFEADKGYKDIMEILNHEMAKD
ncbi:hypothetical protein [Vibrio vulnificus]|uniref:hypothetical protein n=1 Tax=Vibrio vulnificus TaxID=672 RepID=UPI001592CEE4|nr:hypothetical protein [Vibrio vulnificus]NVC72627.1 hypothetical protein [Vibrio vulnificus]